MTALEQVLEATRLPPALMERYRLLIGTFVSSNQEGALLNAARVFAWVCELDALRLGRGTFFDQLMQHSFEATLEVGSPSRFASLVRIANEELSILALETFLAATRTVNDPTAIDSPEVKMLRASLADLGLVGELPRIIVTCVSWSKFVSELRVKEGAGERTITVNAACVARTIAQSIKARRAEEGFTVVLEKALTRAVESPVPELWLDRLTKLLLTENLSEKLAEMAIEESFEQAFLDELVETCASHDEFAEQIDGTIYTGLVWNRALAIRLAELYRELPTVSVPKVQRERRAQAYQAARGLLGEKRRFDAEDIALLLTVNPTPSAQRLHQALEADEVELRLLDRKAFKALLSRGGLPEDARKGAFLPAARTPNKKPIIAIVGLSEEVSAEAAGLFGVFLAGHAIHEYELSSTRPSLARRMRAWLEELRFLLSQGVTGAIDESRALSPLGLGFHVRNKVDLVDHVYPRQLRVDLEETIPPQAVTEPTAPKTGPMR